MEEEKKPHELERRNSTEINFGSWEILVTVVLENQSPQKKTVSISNIRNK